MKESDGCQDNNHAMSKHMAIESFIQKLERREPVVTKFDIHFLTFKFFGA